jgi:hypothetical protein
MSYKMKSSEEEDPRKNPPPGEGKDDKAAFIPSSLGTRSFDKVVIFCTETFEQRFYVSTVHLSW